ncbi:metal dependent phosphohydrolase [Tepidicaulis marinus]|uniref:Metal dependent phosphohydrolase n=2 Tax=Tepidicaulis marinus TaxID=1333998 RepID=A0A081BF67_9HYPH|nr:metal dependent phosphohydrolase [Tepidicaulis marinus]
MTLAPSEDRFLFAEERPAEVAQHGVWKILIVDDEPEVHSVTRLALHDVVFAGRGLELISAHSAAEAEEVLHRHGDIAVILLDVVMETDNAGLELIRRIRDTMRNSATRIILRTGQPGQAPESDVIIRYDINDYREKTDLTSSHLFTAIYGALRAYRDINALEHHQDGLEEVIAATSALFECQTLRAFTRTAEDRFPKLLAKTTAGKFTNIDMIWARRINKDGFDVIAATGSLRPLAGCTKFADLPEMLIQRFEELEKAGSLVNGTWLGGLYRESSTLEYVFYMEGLHALTPTDRNLLDVYMRQATSAFDNLVLTQQIDETQREIVYRLGEAVESRSQETGNHVKRVAEISRLIARGAGLSPRDCDIIFYASPLHDVGKIAIPDAILNKAGKLTPEEWEIMKTHAIKGYEMLSNSERPILKAAAVIARDHHEKWDGSGYPEGRRGEEIDIMGRITAVADVFDALGSDRCYKKAWPLDDVLALFRHERGKHFDPHLVDILFDNLEAVTEIQQRYSD